MHIILIRQKQLTTNSIAPKYWLDEVDQFRVALFDWGNVESLYENSPLLTS